MHEYVNCFLGQVFGVILQICVIGVVVPNVSLLH